MTVNKDDMHLDLRIRKITSESIGINSYELVHPNDDDLPAITPGAHIDIKVPGGFTRQYSICNSPHERHRYLIAVLRDAGGRGGSQALHDNLKVNDVVTVSRPRNNFPLATGAKKYLLLAGGIGVTPLKSMALQLIREGKTFELHYCSKGPEYAAFKDELMPLLNDGVLFMHFDGGVPGEGLNIEQLLADPEDGTHLYYCGPGGFMTACELYSSHWPEGTVHFEHFKAPEVPDSLENSLSEGAFLIKLARSGETLEVPSSKSIAEVLSENGCDIETSCEAGLCATCKVKYLSGNVDHKDFILSESERSDHLTACVSRAISETLELDL